MNRNFLLSIFLVFSIALNAVVAYADNDINLEGFDQFVKEELKSWDVPGVAVAVIRDGKTVLSKGYGYRSLRPRQKVTPETVFPIGSTTKAFTSFALGQLVDEGKINFDSPIRTYIPEFKMDEDYKSDHVTVRDILSHRTGLPPHDFLYYHPQFTRDELIKILPYLQTNKELRQTWQYSNIMYTIAGALIEKISGNTWEEYVKENIFTPLNMTSSNFSVEETQKLDNYAKPYELRKRKAREVSFDPIGVMGPSGSINSNIIDMSEWIKLQLKNFDKPKLNLISEKTLDELHTPAMLVPVEPKYKEFFYNDYALGWVVSSYRGTKVIWHNGTTIGFKALVALLPEYNTGIVILSNRKEILPEIIAKNLYDRIMNKNKIPWSQRYKNNELKKRNEQLKVELNESKQIDKIESHKMTHPIENYTGKYVHPAYGEIVVNSNKNNLTMNYHGIDLQLHNKNYDTFSIYFKDNFEGISPEVSVQFLPDENGNISTISIPFEPAVQNIIFKKTNN